MEELAQSTPPSPKQQLEDLKALKGSLSRQIGQAKKAGEDPDTLIHRLKGVSDEVKALQKAEKKKLNQAEDTNALSEESKLPSRAGPIRNISTKPVHQIVAVVRGAKAELAWDEFVKNHPAATPYHYINIRSFIEQTYGHTTHYCYALSADGEMLGVLPLVQLSSKLFGNFIVSAPYFNYGGLLANNQEAATKLVAAANEWRQNVGASHIELRHLQNSGLELQQRCDKVTFLLPLPTTPELLWQSFRPKLRAQIRRPEREEPEFLVGGPELLDDFYDVFASNMRDLGTPVYGKNFFLNLLQHLGESARLVVVKLSGKPAGCAFLIGHAPQMEIPWASTLREFNSTGINMFMYWKVLEYTIAKGYKVFDFGRCSKDAGTYKFKQQWGAQPIPLHWDYCLPTGKSLPELNPHNPKFKLLIAVWQRLPVWLTRLIGPHIVKSLP
ncbi:FemAB family XrtA/PEP-CTERM system-associated protein [Marinobacter changyiensis]|uniref:FemAB family XrtA/PEP-CTERM system-associated protein n=1 Tax=Marinobacter changyiensis TaxID=2604091 RepID=UPI001264180B|nr:FemAB family XrtA/PEP-CTERM system-associated protein [Marinobacter changyiensis]